jgi:hypothetical protein
LKAFLSALRVWLLRDNAKLHDLCREYEQEIATLTTEKAMLADRLESALADRARVWEELRIALAEERIAYQMQINVESQKHYGVAPFPDAPKLPPSRVVDPPEPGPAIHRMTASQAVAAQTEKFFKDYTARVKALENKS